jgi:hypothetical protein
MPEAIKVLGQLDCPATSLTDLYTAPSAVVGSTLCICNRTGATVTFRVAVAPGGAADDPKHYLYYDKKVLKNDSIFVTIGLTLAATDKVRVYASATGLSFSLFGTEVS